MTTNRAIQAHFPRREPLTERGGTDTSQQDKGTEDNTSVPEPESKDASVNRRTAPMEVVLKNHRYVLTETSD